MSRIIVYLILFLNLFQSCQLSQNIAYNIPDPECTGVFNLCTDVDKERLGRIAVKAIHEQMDDDKDGMIEVTESQEFIKEELESTADEIRHRHFQNADIQITFKDLWTQWHSSAVYNWTNDDIIYWLVNFVQLPIYVENFRRNQFDGRMIPRLASNEKHYISNILHIRDPRHKRRLMIKATDVVLFGPPDHTHNVIKDMILLSAVVISFGACLYAFIRHRRTQESMKVMLKELETLQKAEGDLISVTGKMRAMEYELKDKAKVDRGLLNSWFSEVQRTKEEAEKFRKYRDSTADHHKQLRFAVQEIEQLRIALRKAEEHAEHQSYEPPNELVDLLKRTYYTEEIAFEVNRRAAENAMLQAKEQMNKISKMQKGFFGAVRIAHTGCMDNISELINSAKERLANVQDEYEEREKRWNRIASLLDREDLISNSSSSTTSMGVNQHLTNSSLNNGNSTNISTVSRIRDLNNRSKQMSIDSNAGTNINIDSLSINKSNSILSNRGSPINLLNPMQTAQQDVMTQSDNGIEYTTSPSILLKRRTIGNSTFFNNRLFNEQAANNSTMVHSHSTNGLNDSNTNIPGMVRQTTFDSLDTGSLSKQPKSIFDIVPDFRLDTNDFVLADHQEDSDRKSHTSDDQQSIVSSDKSRRNMISGKILKPFQNIRFRKKTNIT